MVIAKALDYLLTIPATIHNYFYASSLFKQYSNRYLTNN